MTIPPNLLENKKVVVALTGSIALYKSVELVRLLVKHGAKVRVIMSEAAKKFISPLTFETISQNSVLDDTNESWASDFNHIGFAKWADIFIVAPATANTIAKMANAIADNILLQSILAFDGIKLLAPAANTKMLENPITKANLKMLNIANFETIDSQVKELACGDVGNGAMAEPIDIFYSAARALIKDSFWSDRRVIVTGGGTIEKIDEVRYISNFSSGKMASSLATALYLKGADVNLISTRFEPNLPKDLYTIDVTSSDEMREYLVDSIRVAKKGKLSKPTLMSDEPIKLIQKKPYLFMAAAVADYVAKYVQDGKLKKDILGDEWDLKLTKNIDILSSVDKDGLVSIGFKAELDESSARDSAKNMLEAKNLNGVALNILKDSKSFGAKSNQIEFITKDGSSTTSYSDKLSVAFELLELSKKLCDE